MTVEREDVERLHSEVERLRDEVEYDRSPNLLDRLTEAVDALQGALDEGEFTRTYRVTFYRVVSLTVEVEAQDEDDALEEAEDRSYNADIDDDNVDENFSTEYGGYIPGATVEEV